MSPPHLVDTNVHLRISQPDNPLHEVALNAVNELGLQAATLVIALQNLVEYWAVATRPKTSRGGLGLSAAEARLELSKIVELFTLLPESPNVLSQW